MRRSTWLAGPLAILTCLTVGAGPASAEWFADLYGGAAFTENTDITIQVPAVMPGVDIVFKDVEFDAGLSLGGRLGYWFESSPVLGVALDVSHFSPDIPPQPVVATVIGSDDLAHINGEVTLVAVELMLRWPLLATREIPKGRLQPYVAVGPAIGIVEANDTTTLSPPGQSATDVTVAVVVVGGLAWQFHRHFAIFAEYRFTYVRPTFELSDRGADETVSLDLATHHLLAGVSFRF